MAQALRQRCGALDATGQRIAPGRAQRRTQAFGPYGGRQRRAQLAQQAGTGSVGAVPLCRRPASPSERQSPLQFSQTQLLLDKPRGRVDEPLHHMVQSLDPRVDGVRTGACETLRTVAQAADQCLAIGGRQRCSRGRRRRAHIGDEIADREVGLVADAGNDRQRRLEDRARRPPR